MANKYDKIINLLFMMYIIKTTHYEITGKKNLVSLFWIFLNILNQSHLSTNILVLILIEYNII
jgi:hypothetical protein